MRESEPAKGGAIGQSWHDHSRDSETGNAKTLSSKGYQRRQTTGWSPSCACDPDCEAGTLRCTVLDPFAGSGTTLMVAERLGRDSIGIELNPEYAVQAQARIRADLGRVTSALRAPADHGPLFGGGA